MKKMFQKMHRLVLFFIFNLCLNLDFSLCFNPDGIDYCDIKCYPKNATSSGCGCNKHLPGRTLKTDDLPKFRKFIVNIHNKLRNKVARGDVDNFPPAGNMRVMNYDLELEYLAQCFILSRFNNNYDPCPSASYCENSPTGQNVVGHPIESPDKDKSFVMYWYNHKNKVSDADTVYLVDSFRIGPWNPFIRIVWAKTDRVGCARGRLPNNPNKHFRYIMVCNYARHCSPCGSGSKRYNYWRVYHIGVKCSRCYNLKCNNELGGPYDALCGKKKKIGSDLGDDKTCNNYELSDDDY